MLLATENSGMTAEPTSFKREMLATLPSLRAFAVSLTGKHDKADDLVQDTVMKAWAKQSSFEMGTNIKAWLFTILRNEFYSQMRKRGREVQDTDGAFTERMSVHPSQYGVLDMAVAAIGHAFEYGRPTTGPILWDGDSRDATIGFDVAPGLSRAALEGEARRVATVHAAVSRVLDAVRSHLGHGSGAARGHQVDAAGTGLHELRAGLGLPPLVLDPELTSVAQSWAEQMAATGVLDHPPDVAAGIDDSRWLELGDNIGKGSTFEIAWQALVETAGVGPGSRVLVLAAAGGVGHLAVQIAKALGAHVLGTARAEKHAFLASLGVDEPVDYTTGPLAGRLRDVDVVFDLLGPDAAADAVPTLRDGGVLVTAASGSGLAPLHDAAEGRVEVFGTLVEPDRLGMESLAALVEEGRLRPHVAETFPLADAARAHERGETGRTQGKLVLVVG